jgi:hypothetical protein
MRRPWEKDEEEYLWDQASLSTVTTVVLDKKIRRSSTGDSFLLARTTTDNLDPSMVTSATLDNEAERTSTCGAFPIGENNDRRPGPLNGHNWHT